MLTDLTDMAGIGGRVVRGPDWKWGKQDGGEGRVGTLRSYESHEEVLVVWDNGTAANYRCSSQFDLRLLDNGPAGIKHDGFVCEGCQSTPIYGIRWDCTDCPSVSLCSGCYHSDKHNLKHQFTRSTNPSSRKVHVPVRRKSKKIPARGLYLGARVVRGLDWQWEEQDGGEGKKGKVTAIEPWLPAYPRSGVFVVWDNAMKNLYRSGFEGMVDVKSINEAKGNPFYRDHLPLVGEDVEITAGYFQNGDQVCVESDEETVRLLQEGHGGWAEGMREVLGLVGVVSGIDVDGDIVVQYSGPVRWTFNPILLKKMNTPTREVTTTSPQRTSLSLSGLMDPFMIGDVIRIANDEQYVKKHQRGHGDWAESMRETLGQIGRVVEVTPTGDIRAEVCSSVWTYSPANLSRVDIDGAPLTPGTSHNVSIMLRHVFESHQASQPIEELIQAAAIGDLSVLEKVISQRQCQVDEFFGGRSAIHVGCQNGHVDIVKCLISHEANLEEEDADGDRPVHYASFSDEPDIIDVLADHGVDLNARNRRQQTPLHIAVSKGHMAVIRVLLQRHCHPSLQDTGGDTPLHDAISKKRDDIVELLLVGEAEIDVANSNGFNCLHHASLRGNLGAVRLLIQYIRPPCHVDTPKEDGFTSLHLATLNNHIEVAKLLIEHGGNSNAENMNRQTPLHLAVERQNTQIVRLLVEEGGHVNAIDLFGDTPLHNALRHHTMTQLKELKQTPQDVSKVMTSTQKNLSTSTAIYLASHSADFTILNTSGQSPLDLCSDPSLIKLLKKAQQAQQDCVNNATDLLQPEMTNICLTCSSRPRDTLFSPCGHVASCNECVQIQDKPVVCKRCGMEVKEHSKIEECLVCSEVLADVLFQPCLHMVVCDGCAVIMKKCVKCRVPIESIVPREVCCGGKPRKRRSGSKAGLLTHQNDDATVLMQQLQDLKEKTICVVCMDRRKNCAFLCGHGACQPCADKLTECPICRKTLDKKIILFD